VVVPSLCGLSQASRRFGDGIAEITSKMAKVIQAFLAVAVVASAVCFYLNMRDRRVILVEAPKKEVALNPDDYVVPKKLHPQDAKDARELMLQPVWVREGYRYDYYRYGPPVDFREKAGMLGPIEQLQVKNIVMQTAPEGGRQIMAVFAEDGKSYVFSIGIDDNGTQHIYSDDMLFVQDPHELYKHWPADVWKAIENHAVKPGMNELQASFALGVGIPEGTGTSNPKIVNYPNAGHPVKITFENGRATDIRQVAERTWGMTVGQNPKRRDEM
jgi:hypothetical protein